MSDKEDEERARLLTVNTESEELDLHSEDLDLHSLCFRANLWAALVISAGVKVTEVVGEVETALLKRFNSFKISIPFLSLDISLGLLEWRATFLWDDETTGGRRKGCWNDERARPVVGLF